MTLPLLVALAACSGGGPRIDAQLARARAEVARTGPAPAADWSPDLRVWLGDAAVRELTEAALAAQGPIEGSVRAGPLVLRPRLRPTALSVGSVDRETCAGCAAIDVRLQGEVVVEGALRPLTLRAEADVGLDVVVEGRRGPEGFVVTLRPARVRRVDLDVAGGSLPIRPEGPLRGLLEEALTTKVPPARVLTLDERLPVQALRVERGRAGLALALLTDVATPDAVDGPAPRDHAVGVRIGAGTLTTLVARETLTSKPSEAGLLVQPRALRPAGDGLAVDLRVWRPGRSGWWRDVSADLTWSLADDTVDVGIREVAVGKASRGAALGDPVAALAASALPWVLPDVLTQAVPRLHEAPLPGQDVAVSLTGLGTDGDDVVLTADLARPAGRVSPGGRPKTR